MTDALEVARGALFTARNRLIQHGLPTKMEDKALAVVDAALAAPDAGSVLRIRAEVIDCLREENAGLRRQRDELHETTNRYLNRARAAEAGAVEVAPGTGPERINYVLRYGGMCRGCADHDGVCPTNGLPCDTEAARRSVRHVLEALDYGERHGYLPAPPAPGGWKPVGTAPCDGKSVVLGNPEWDGVMTREFYSEDDRDAALANWDGGPTVWMRPAPPIAAAPEGEDA